MNDGDPSNEVLNKVAYKISDGIVTGIHMDIQSKALIVSLDVSVNGELTIELPRKLIDSKNGENDDAFIVLIDGEKQDFTEVRNDTNRILTIKFLWDKQAIVIIGTAVMQQKI